ncbi:hypothetical protein ANAEL_01680 [Anaerolineales bacterium]|nr:hypothetical protein ANAEL_01680 [Anaerolineales bacterium]
MKEYTLNNQIYTAKPRYPMQVFGEILKVLADGKKETTEATVLNLLTSGGLVALLSLILDRPVDGELYAEDFPVVNEVINDFFFANSKLMGDSESPSNV